MQKRGSGRPVKVDEARALIAKTWQEPGGAEILINNAGTEKKRDFAATMEEDFDYILDYISGVNLKGPFFTTQSFVQRLCEHEQ